MKGETSRPDAPGRFLDYLVLAIGLGIAWIFGQRFNFILDDAFISLRYAKNLFLGYGLRFNPGEAPVEGYTNFLWVLLQALHFPFTRFPEHWLLLYNKLAGLALVVAVWWELRRRVSTRPWVWLGVLLVACHETVHAWMGGGLETLFFCVLILVGMSRFLREEFESTAGFTSAFCLGLAALTRPEAYLFIGIAWVTLIARRHDWPRRALKWSLVVAVICLPHILFRIFYYHAL
ncbi:MAG: hypothetical protein ABIT01_14265, partial [Thermoanaerobaculia bacterium]